MKPEKITIDDVEYVRADSIQTPETAGNNFVIARCRNAGVHAGTLVSRENGVVKLANSRRLWRWWSKFTLSELAVHGILDSQADKQKYSCVTPELDLTESDVCEIIYCTTNAIESIMNVKETINE